MESMEALITQIQGLSGSVEDISHLHNLLKLTEESLQSEAPRLASFLGQLDPAKQSLGYLYILEAYTSAPISREQPSEFIMSVSTFINSCLAEQIRLAADKFVSVCKRFKDQVVLLQEPLRGVAPMRTAVQKLRSSSEHLTALHPDFLLLCLLAKSYKTGLGILKEDIFEIDQPRDFFLYCYYGGMICIGQKHFCKARELLRNPYIDLANSYSSGKISELESCVETNKEKFESDNNLGLVKQVVSSLYKRNIQRLTLTYLTLSLQDIANTVQLNTPKEAEMHVLRMIQDGEIFATINQKDEMVSFHEDPEQYKTCEMIEHIDSSIQRIMSLSKKLSAVDELISYDPAYLAKAGKERQRFDFDDFDTVPQKFNL
ncbi:PREDICTED: COP9 signalosome complex subunit 3-like isoform X4 [Nelumbo nucifera]|uniref:COP9 signalosome complex subunit 3 n=1 Tax=Nelumbo nucifera TaxID=4432 RepID=A0A1U7ZNN1_NELNU|nr:PREDICTED: COP9 signalosome complex subunit 3-like isoform X4 [Nelumbo nucifera]